MKFQPDLAEGVNLITRVDDAGAWVGRQRMSHPFLLPWQGDPQAWPVPAFEQLEPDHFDAVLVWKPELVIFGSGPRLRFPHPSLYRRLIDARVGIETMDTAAACRTFNVLAGEGRCVVAAVLLSG